ncbi:hypothetical protein IFM89_026663 [Coptis chinensis]|uniref:Uncharacterized protein n=1 Tax=Coptis chinensis TaxID=261450 RepID=A0A835MAU0_9MAGN|nr:hypothetical protein IFM89_026663 [Coptis chinensis]
MKSGAMHRVSVEASHISPLRSFDQISAYENSFVYLDALVPYRIRKNTEMARRVAEDVLRLDPLDTGHCTLGITFKHSCFCKGLGDVSESAKKL